MYFLRTRLRFLKKSASCAAAVQRNFLYKKSLHLRHGLSALKAILVNKGPAIKYIGIGLCISFLASCAQSPQTPSSRLPANTNFGASPSTSNQNANAQSSTGQAFPTRVGSPYRLTPVSWSEVEGWQEDSLSGVMQVLYVNCKRVLEPSKANVTPQLNWQQVCSRAQSLSLQGGEQNLIGVRAFFEQNFLPFQLSGEQGNVYGLVTGYYEPVLRGSRTRRAPYLHALYRWPSRYPAGQKLPARAELLRSGMLQGEELVYVDDPIEAFFLQIQGSGRIVMEDGSTMRVGYNGTNGQPYHSIGRWLVDRGEVTLSQTSIQGLRKWARAHPKRVDGLLAVNPRFVFFKDVTTPAPSLPSVATSAELGQERVMVNLPGPIGALGVPLTPERSIAVDPNAIPLGAPVFLSTTRPATDEPLRRLVFAQDVGAAIRGGVRADYFWGFGDEAGDIAGRMRQQGRMWLLLPKP